MAATSNTKSTAACCQELDSQRYILRIRWLHHTPRVQCCTYGPVGVHSCIILWSLWPEDLVVAQAEPKTAALFAQTLVYAWESHDVGMCGDIEMCGMTRIGATLLTHTIELGEMNVAAASWTSAKDASATKVI